MSNHILSFPSAAISLAAHFVSACRDVADFIERKRTASVPDFGEHAYGDVPGYIPQLAEKREIEYASHKTESAARLVY